jgi:hypothetical protein
VKPAQVAVNATAKQSKHNLTAGKEEKSPQRGKRKEMSKEKGKSFIYFSY